MVDFGAYFLGHFYALKMRPVSAFDPAGFIWLLMFVILTLGTCAGLVRNVAMITWAKGRYEGAKSNVLSAKRSVEKNIQDVSEYISDSSNIGRQGFVAEMLSYSYLSRLCFSLVVFAAASYLNALAAVVAGWRTPNIVLLDLHGKDDGRKTLPDLGHDLFKYVMSFFYGQTTYIEWFDLPDEFIAFVGTAIAVFLILHPKRLLILRRMTAIYAFINLLRACCVAVTSLPDASPQCISQFTTERGEYKSRPIFPKAFFRAFKVLSKPSLHITCGDMVFSGHCVFLVLCAMVFKTYCCEDHLSTPFTRRFPIVFYARYVIYFGAFLGAFAIIGTRLHYTLDVLIATYITIQSWTTYHWYIGGRLQSLRILDWLEHDEVHTVDSDAYRRARRKESQDCKVE